MSEAVWKIAKKCWHGDPKERPEAKTTLQYLENTTTVGRCSMFLFAMGAD